MPASGIAGSDGHSVFKFVMNCQLESSMVATPFYILISHACFCSLPFSATTVSGIHSPQTCLPLPLPLPLPLILQMTSPLPHRNDENPQHPTSQDCSSPTTSSLASLPLVPQSRHLLIFSHFWKVSATMATFLSSSLNCYLRQEVERSMWEVHGGSALRTTPGVAVGGWEEKAAGSS